MAREKLTTLGHMETFAQMQDARDDAQEERLRNLENAFESADYPGCYYRVVDDVVEWINPPMVFGVEYRLAERWNGMVRYTMAVNLGTLPNATTKTIDPGIGIVNSVFMQAAFVSTTGGTHMAPFCNTSAVAAYVYVTQAGIITVRANDDRSGCSGVLTIKYSKSDYIFEITKQPEDVSVALGEAVEVTVEATGEELTYQWYFARPGNDYFEKSSNNTATYTTTMTEARNGYRVYCEITDTYGRILTSEIATLTAI